LDAPVKRVAPPSTPAPYSPPQEAEWLPGVKEIADAIRDVMVDS
jgi:2-oxoisovalerate dehydrogenase E1 component